MQGQKQSLGQVLQHFSLYFLSLVKYKQFSNIFYLLFEFVHMYVFMCQLSWKKDILVFLVLLPPFHLFSISALFFLF